MSGIRDTAYPQMKSAPSAKGVGRCIHAELRGVGVGGEADPRISAARGSPGIAQDLSASRVLHIAAGSPSPHTRTCGTVRWLRFNPQRFVPLRCQFGPSPAHAPDSRLHRGQGLGPRGSAGDGEREPGCRADAGRSPRYDSGANFLRMSEGWLGRNYLQGYAARTAAQMSGAATGLPGKVSILNCCFRIFSASSMPLIVIVAVSNRSNPSIGRTRCLMRR